MTRRYILCATLSFFLSLFLCKGIIPLLRRWKSGQNILSYVQEHKKKSGTPTMGGLAFIPAAIIISLFFLKGLDRSVLVVLTISFAFLILGFLDDYTKKRRKENLGLTAKQKILFQFCVSVLAGLYVVHSGNTALILPFSKTKWEIGWFMLPLTVFVFLSAVNCVNLTDGLDGLAASTCLPYFLFLGLILLVQRGDKNFALISFSLTGALLGYLLFNTHPASLFMGDTGSLSLGGFVACLSVFSGNALLVAILGIAFVLSGISVVLQVLYFKSTGGRRIFLMSPIHHHFQQKGFSETKISYVYAVITVLVGAFLLLPIV